ncbi:MAG: glycosyl hydrolase family 28-related protein, partial [Bacteroidota bacterium]
MSNTVLNILDFGAVGDGSTDDSPAFLKAFAELKTRPIYDPTGGNNPTHGVGQIHVPKGIYRIDQPIFLKNALGFKITGESTFASCFLVDPAHFKKPNGWIGDAAMFNLHTYNTVSFEDLTFIHRVEHTNNKEEWDINLFNLNGQSGGRNFSLHRCRTQNFQRILNFQFAVEENNSNPPQPVYYDLNEDTTSCFN